MSPGAEDPSPERTPDPHGAASAGVLTAFQRWTVGAVVGILYALGMIAQGEALPGIVGGVLAAILCYLVLKRVGDRARARRR